MSSSQGYALTLNCRIAVHLHHLEGLDLSDARFHKILSTPNLWRIVPCLCHAWREKTEYKMFDPEHFSFDEEIIQLFKQLRWLGKLSCQSAVETTTDFVLPPPTVFQRSAQTVVKSVYSPYLTALRLKH